MKDISYSTKVRMETTSKTRASTIPFSAIKGYVIAVYDAQWYLACVLDVYPATKEIRLSFLHPEGPARSYNYPRIPDILVMDSGDILHVVDPTTITGRAYMLSSQDTAIANNAITHK